MEINIFKKLLLFISQHLKSKKSDWKKVKYSPTTVRGGHDSLFGMSLLLKMRGSVGS